MIYCFRSAALNAEKGTERETQNVGVSLGERSVNSGMGPGKIRGKRGAAGRQPGASSEKKNRQNGNLYHYANLFIKIVLELVLQKKVLFELGVNLIEST